jgi:hypothetical protein
MNRFTLAVAVAIASASAFASVGCAAGVEDDQPEEVVEPQRSPPAQLRSGEQADPLANIVGSVDDVRLDLRVPAKTPLPGPNN